MKCHLISVTFLRFSSLLALYLSSLIPGFLTYSLICLFTSTWKGLTEKLIHRLRLKGTSIWRTGVKERNCSSFLKRILGKHARQPWPALLSPGATSEATKSVTDYVSPMQSTEGNTPPSVLLWCLCMLGASGWLGLHLGGGRKPLVSGSQLIRDGGIWLLNFPGTLWLGC